MSTPAETNKIQKSLVLLKPLNVFTSPRSQYSVTGRRLARAIAGEVIRLEVHVHRHYYYSNLI